MPVEAPDVKVSIGWEIAQAFGLLAVVCCLVLLLIPVRPRLISGRTLSLRRHDIIAWIALIATAVHIVLLLAIDPRVVEHLKLTAPIYEWAGMSGLLLLIGLVPISTGPIRRMFWASHRSFQAVHVSLPCVLVVALAVHVVVAGHFVHGRARTVLYLGISVTAPRALLRARGSFGSIAQTSPTGNRLVFGRHSRKIFFVVVIASLATAALLDVRAPLLLRGPILARVTPLRVEFPHDKHREVNCVECHHNFIDRTGSGGCFPVTAARAVICAWVPKRDLTISACLVIATRRRRLSVTAR